MNNKFIVILIMLMLLTSTLMAKISSISGTIYDSATLEPLPFTNVVISGTYLGTTSNVDGYFYLGSIEQDTINLIVSYIGYQTTYKTLYYISESHVVLSLGLMSKTLGGKEVLVEDSLVIADKIVLSSIYIDIGFPYSAIQERPHIEGIKSDIKRIKFEPSKQLRKGGDQIQYLVDGVPAFNTRHLFSVYEAFNLDGLKYVKNHNISQGPQPFKNAPKVTEIIFNEGNRTQLDGHGELGLIESNLTLSGPHPANGSWYVSGRRADFDGLYSLMAKDNANGVGLFRAVPDYSFYDINSKFTIDISEDTKASANLFLSYDKLIWTGSENQHALSDWYTNYASMRFQHRISPQFLTRGLFAHNGYGADLVDANFIQNKDSSFSSELSLKYNTTLISVESDYFTSKNSTIKGGATIEHVTSSFMDFDSTSLKFPAKGRIFSHINAEYHQGLKKNIDVSGGLNIIQNHDIGKAYFDPYLRLNWEPMNIYGLGFGVSHHTSMIVQESIRGLQSFPIYDFILPVDNSIAAPVEWDFVVESWAMNAEGQRGSVELGYKRISEYSILDSVWSPDVSSLNSMLISGFSGNSFTSNVKFEQQWDTYSLNINYKFHWSSLSNGDLTIKDPRERNHTFKMSFSGPSPFVVDGFDVSMILASGNGYLDQSNEWVNQNIFHRIDMSAYKKFNYGVLSGVAKFGISNLTNASTPDFPTNAWVLGSQYDREFALLPFMPTVAFEFTF